MGCLSIVHPYHPLTTLSPPSYHHSYDPSNHHSYDPSNHHSYDPSNHPLTNILPPSTPIEIIIILTFLLFISLLCLLFFGLYYYLHLPFFRPVFCSFLSLFSSCSLTAYVIDMVTCPFTVARIIKNCSISLLSRYQNPSAHRPKDQG